MDTGLVANALCSINKKPARTPKKNKSKCITNQKRNYLPIKAKHCFKFFIFAPRKKTVSDGLSI
ncbi:hypothetical protein A5893_11900 [Pedobacter psychrophilus]|uniref:Uncharacterized protein n=1 Tax=Pedobacter psychrophilus TaxID=1826909 RepID=A0A179DCH7_9SPHI|nr:hypothetical protein A5893_11900 [Pedobacter psychrophilus]